MKLSVPDELDDTVHSMSVTFWSDAKRKWLIQWEADERRPCFALIEGVRRSIALTFDESELFRKLLRCLAANERPASLPTEWPSLLIQIAFETFNVYANVRAHPEDLTSFATRELVEYLQTMIAAATESA